MPEYNEQLAGLYAFLNPQSLRTLWFRGRRFSVKSCGQIGDLVRDDSNRWVDDVQFWVEIEDRDRVRRFEEARWTPDGFVLPSFFSEGVFVK